MRSLSDVLARIERRVSQALVAAFVGLILIALRILRRLIDGHRDTRSEAEVRL